MSQVVHSSKRSAKFKQLAPIAFGQGKSVLGLSRSGVLFNGGSPLEFTTVKEEIVNRFKGEGVYHHISFPPGIARNELVEETFTMPMPDHETMVNGQINTELAYANYTLANNVLLMQNLGYDAERRKSKSTVLEQAHNQVLQQINTKHPVYERDYRDALKLYISERDKFNKERADCMKVFNQVLGSVTISQIQAELSAGRYRHAWFDLLQYNTRVILGQANIGHLMHQVTHMQYDAAETPLMLLEADFNALYTQLNQFDGEGAVTQAQKLHHFMNALRTSPGGEYKDVLSHIGYSNLSVQESFDLIHRTGAQLSISADIEPAAVVPPKVKAPPVTVAAVASTPHSAKKKWCDVCKINTHNRANCWKFHTCTLCNNKGHPEKHCKVTATSNSAPVVNDRFVKTNKASKYYTSSNFCVDGVTTNALLLVPCQHNGSTTSISDSSDDIFTVDSMPDQHIKDRLYNSILTMKTMYSYMPCRIILDSGATTHMLPYSDMFVSMVSAQGYVILGSNVDKLVIEGKGHTSISYLHDVLYVPQLSVGVFSVPAFDKKQCTTVFKDGKGIVYDYDNNVLLTSTLSICGLYEVDILYVNYLLGQYNNTVHYDIEPALCNVCHDSANDSTSIDVSMNSMCIDAEENTKFDSSNVGVMREYTNNAANINVYVSDAHTHVIVNMSHCMNSMSSTMGLNPLEILHRQWGHMGEANIKRALKDNTVANCKYTYNDVKDLSMRICFDCLQGRMKAKSSRPTTDHPWAPFEKIAIDFKGYFPKRALHGERGFMLLVDYATNYLYVGLVKRKSEHTRVLEDYMNKVIKPYGKKWKVLQSDSDSIFKSSNVAKWLRKHDISIQLSTPYQHWENGQVEVYVGIVMDKCRTIMCCYNTPSKYWSYAVLYAVYVINRAPTANNSISAHESLTGEKPDVSMYVPFYAPGVYHISKEERSKNPLASRAEPCRMLGYAEGYSNAYYVLNIRTGRVVVRENCIFDISISADDVTEIDVDNSDTRNDIDDYEELVDEFPDDDVDVVSDDEHNDVPIMRDTIMDDDDIDDTTTVESDDTPYSNEYVSVLSLYSNWYSDIVHTVHSAIALPPNPKSVDEALSGPDRDKWEAAIQKELSQFELRNTFGYAEQTGQGMKTKLILYYKYDGEYNVVCKARLVVCGYSQRKGIDYHDTYSPTTTNPIVFLLLHIAGLMQVHAATFDVSAAFLEGRADTEMYAWLPAELSSLRKSVRVKILGNWYGSKQAGKIWNDLFHDIVVVMNFTQCPVMPCLYMWSDDIDFIIMTVHVDDGLLVCSRQEIADDFMRVFLTHVRKAVMYSTVNLYLGMDITRSHDGSVFFVNQQNYIEKEFSDYHRTVRTPMSVTTNLRIAVSNASNESLLHDTGRFRFLADRTRPDILYAVGEISTGGDVAPSDDHCRVSKRIMNYLTCTKELSMRLGGNGVFELFAYCDASYISIGKCRSRLGSCVFAGYDSGAISSVSKNDTVVAHSSTEAEIKAIDMLCREIVYWRDVLKFLNREPVSPTRIYVDNKSAIELCRILKVNHRTRHINVRIQYIRELINARVIELVFVPTALNVADMLTKGLCHSLHVRHTTVLMQGHAGIDLSFMYPDKTYALYMLDITDEYNSEEF